MQPVQITIRDLPNSLALEDHIRRKAEKLSQFCQKIQSCRIVITIPQKHKHQGKLFCVRIDLTVPGKELAVNRKMDEDVYIAIRDAFHALQRRLETYECKKRGYVKKHNESIHGHVSKLFANEGYGFIQGTDGNEYYFSLSNVAYPDFGQLKLGDGVEFLGIPGSEGAQAHHVIKERENEWAFDSL